MSEPKLFMILLGCKPPGRHIEQHDIFFSIGESINDIVPEIIQFWPEAAGKIHIDGWREVTHVGEFKISVVPKDLQMQEGENEKLFFINLGGYKENEFDEYHYKLLSISKDRIAAIEEAKKTAFYKHVQFPGAESHIDDKYGIDVDDIYQIEDILPAPVKEKYAISILKTESDHTDKLYLGYFNLKKLADIS